MHRRKSFAKAQSNQHFQSCIVFLKGVQVFRTFQNVHLSLRVSHIVRLSAIIMSLRGIRQLKELVVRYSDLDGSSKGVREWMRVAIVDMATDNPDLTIKTELKRAVHPFLRGIYHNGNSKTICIKNISPEEVHQYALDLRNQIGRKTSSNGYKNPIVSTRPSIQGEWNERMDLIDLKLTISHHK